MNSKVYILGTCLVFLCFMQDIAEAHLDEPCNLGICVNTFFVPIKNAYCDMSDNICKCNKGFVQVGRHKCAEFQQYGGQCEHENMCKATDENLVCDRTRYKPLCECRKGFYYEVLEKKCIPQIKKPKSTPLFPITAVVLIACIGIFCGCGIICHNFRRQPELSVSVDQLRGRPVRPPNGGAAQARSGGGVNASANNASESRNHPPLLRSASQTSSKYDEGLLYDEPPPKYEDAIKDYPTVLVLTSIDVVSNNNNNNRRALPLPLKS